MKFLIVFVALFAIALAAPVQEVEVLRSDINVGPESFQYNVETSDGNKQQAEGRLENPGSEDEAISVKGSFSFVADDGLTYTIDYIADKNGYQPSGAHLPVAPVA